MLVVSNGKVNYELGRIVWVSIWNVLGIRDFRKLQKILISTPWPLCQELNPGPLTYEVDTLAIPW